MTQWDTLFERMQADEKCNASIGAMQGVLPSYTPLGMASLLPHKTIEYSPSYDVLVDGKACSSTEQREAILKEYKVKGYCGTSGVWNGHCYYPFYSEQILCSQSQV